MKNRVCGYYACPLDGDIEEGQQTITNHVTEEGGTFHVNCFVLYLQEKCKEIHLKRRE